MCVWSPLGQALGFPRIPQGHRGQPEKFKAVEDMSPPQTLKEMKKIGWSGNYVRALHLQAGGACPTLLQADEKEGPVRVDPSVGDIT